MKIMSYGGPVPIQVSHVKMVSLYGKCLRISYFLSGKLYRADLLLPPPTSTRKATPSILQKSNKEEWSRWLKCWKESLTVSRLVSIVVLSKLGKAQLWMVHVSMECCYATAWHFHFDRIHCNRRGSDLMECDGRHVIIMISQRSCGRQPTVRRILPNRPHEKWHVFEHVVSCVSLKCETCFHFSFMKYYYVYL